MSLTAIYLTSSNKNVQDKRVYEASSCFRLVSGTKLNMIHMFIHERRDIRATRICNLSFDTSVFLQAFKEDVCLFISHIDVISVSYCQADVNHI